MASTSNYRVAKSTRRTPTCDMCKSRHQKCNGAQPQCSNCELRAIACSYNNMRRDQPGTSPSSASASIETSSRLKISTTEYDRLYSQIFNDIVQRLQLEGNQNAKIGAEADAYSGPCNASLPSFYQDVSNLLKEELAFNSRHISSQMDGSMPPTNQLQELVLERNLDHIRKMLRNSLPPRDVASRLLRLFIEYQNSLFYVCNRAVVYEQLDHMYNNSDQMISISWFCQMFLIFAVGAQFDDLDDGDGESYYQISQKHLDDAIEESPQDTLWIMRAMLLLCFYQPPTKWSSIWIYLDVAIRTAQRFQLDVGENLLKELSEPEYQEWRQLWLTLVSFDRWVAVFLGRLPRVRASISKDPIFKDIHFTSGLESCVMQNHITRLAIISGHILNDLYFSEQRSLSISQQRKRELETWMATLPNLLQNFESNVASDLPKDQLEAVFNLHFLHLGAWMLLTRPSLLKVVKSGTLPNNFAGPISSVISSDAKICIDSAFRLINSATTMLSEPLSPKRSFMPLFFLANAAHVIILGAIWNMKQNSKGDGSMAFHDQSRELTSIDASTRILDLCGQRNAFARKYSLLIKDLRQNLSDGMPDVTNGVASSPPAISRANPLSIPAFYNSPLSPLQSPSNSDSANTNGSQGYIGGNIDSNNNGARPLLQNGDRQLSTSTIASMDVATEPWSEHFGIFYPTNDVSSSLDHSNLLNDSDSSFLERMWQ